MTLFEGWFYLNLVAGVALFGTVETWSQAIMELSWYALTAAALARKRINPLAVPPLAVGCAGMAALAVWQAVTGNTASVWGSWGAVRLWVMYACAAWAAAALISTRVALKRAIAVVFVAALGVAVEGLLQRWRPSHAIYGLRVSYTAFGPFYNRDHAAGFMAVGAALGLGLIAAGVARFSSSRRRTVGRTADLWAVQLVLAALVGSLGAGMAAAGSRGATHGLLAGAGLILYLGARRFAAGQARWALFAGVLVAGAAYAGLVTALPKFAGWLEVERTFDASTQARFAMWRQSMTMVRERPATGWGVGAFRYAFAPRQIGEPMLRAGQVQHAHGDWIQFLVEGGAVGLFLMVAALGWQLRRQIGQWRKDHDLEVWGLLGGTLAATLTLVVHGCVDFDLEIPGLMVVFVSVASFFYPLRSILLNLEPWNLKRGTLLASALACVLLGWSGVGAARAGYAWNLARLSVAQDAGMRVGLLARALQHEPGNPAYTRDLGVAYLWLGYENSSATMIYAMKARDVAAAGLAGTPDHPGLLEIRGNALLRLHRPAEAKVAMDRAKALQPWKR